MSTVTTSSRWPVGLLDRIQRYADAHGISRQAAMSVLCSVAVLQWERTNGLSTVVGPTTPDQRIIRSGRPRPPKG